MIPVETDVRGKHAAHFKQDSSTYVQEEETHTKKLFWAQQQQSLQPACVVHVRTVKDVVLLIRTSRASGCPMAVRGGGHADRPGASNIHGGITVNMAGLNDIHVDEGAGIVRVGAGATWGLVYRELDRINRTVVGGRLTDVGVGGLLLGGGLSHLSGLHGWACDNVSGYEVVLANSSVIYASSSAHPDLYRALRGGGNNFGIVTRFDLDLYPQGPVWGGLHVWPLRPSVTTALTTGFVKFAHDAPSSPSVSLFAGLGYMAVQGTFAWAVGQYDTSHITTGTNLTESYAPLGSPGSPILAQFRENIEMYGVAKIVSTARLASMSDLADELNGSEPAGRRSRFTTATFRADADLLRTMAGFFAEQVNKALIDDNGLRNDAGFAPMLGMQPLTRNFLREQAKRGGNVMGLDEEDGPLVVCSFGWEWSHSSHDDIVIAGIKAVLEQSVAVAKERGLYHPFKYMNYAAQDQSPFASYGSDNVEFLKGVRRLYDAEGFFTTLVPGGFKLG
ncbi:hypothetical protein E4U21_004905 [Claviceps maximensis]|nr:hypothetical protein E4U21_004905 [Claviceps maximensis]